MKTIIIMMVAVLMALTASSVEAKTRPIDLMSRKDSQHCIASAIYYEALGESMAGKIAVASVVMNRVKSGRYPSDPCAVIYQKGQFSWINPRYRTLVYSPAMWTESMRIAQAVISGEYRDNTRGALFFHNRRVHPKDMRSRRVTTVIGEHVFMR